MKVVQINSCCGCYSTGKIVSDLSKVLFKNGDNSFAFYGTDFVQTGIDSKRIGHRFTVKSNTLISRLTDGEAKGAIFATKKLVDDIKRLDPDIIHLHNIHGNYVNIKILFNFLKKSNKPVVWTLHDCWAFTGHCAYFDLVGCDKWKKGCYNCPQKKSYPQSLLMDNSEDNYQKKKELFTKVKNMTIVTPSKWLADLARESFLNKYPIKTIPNGIDLESFKPINGDFRKKNNIEDKKIILGVASVWDERKGLEDFIKLSKLLDDSFKIILVGLNEKQLKTLPEEILGISRTHDITELSEIYTTVDVFVNPTYEDNFPTTNIEALACGTPVITYKTGGSPESLDETCGVVIEKGNVDKLHEAIARVCNEKPFLKEACIARSKMFDKNERFNEYVEIYGVI